MLIRTCAHNNFSALPKSSFCRTALSKEFVFTLAIVLLVFLPFVSAFSADEKTVASPSAAASPDKAKPPNGKSSASASALKDTTQIVVRFIVNTETKGDFFAEIDNKGNLYLSLEEAQKLKLKYSDDYIVLIRGDEQYVPLKSILDVTSTFDEAKLIVTVIGKTTESGKTVADLFSLKAATKNIYYPRETSAFLNYGLNYIYTNTDGFQSFNVTNKAGFRTGDFFITSDSLYTKMEDNDNFVRLQSSATYERRKDLQWFVLGDQYANSGELGSTVNMGGIGFSKVYRMDPYFITQPVMDLKGSVIFPTQAEIYLDGVLIGKQAITPGSFELKNIYSYVGSHRVQVVLKDPFGNEQKIDYLAYFSSQMLRKGLHEYSYNAGVLRENYGVDSNQYGKPVFSMFHRYGVTNNFNIGARAEGSDGTYSGGVSTALAIPRIGQFTLYLAGSTSSGNDLGGAASLQHSYQLGNFNTNLLIRGYSHDYATVGSPLRVVGGIMPSTEKSQYEMNIGMGYTFAILGNVSLNYTETSTFNNTDTRVISASYSRTLFRSISMFATGTATHTSTDAANNTNYGFYVGLNLDFGKGIRGSAQVSGSTGNVNSETLQVQKDMPIGEGLGYRASLSRSETSAQTTSSFNPYVQYNAKYGIYSLDATVKDSEGTTSEQYNLSAAGSLVYVGGFYGLSRPVSDSFGVVVLNKEVPGATVTNNGSDVGKPGSSGTLIVPTLSSYGQNKVSLDTKNVPLDYSISDVNKLISPSLWSGSCIYFDAMQMRALTGTLVTQKEGKKIPLEFVEISMKFGEKIFTYPTGKGGEIYIDNSIPREEKEGTAEQKNNAADNMSCRAITLQRKTVSNVIGPGSYPAFVESGEGKCTFMITFPDTKEQITDIGEIQCIGSQSSAPSSVPAAAPSVPSKRSLPQGNKLYYEQDEANLRGSPLPAESPPAVAALPPHQVSETLPVKTSLSAPEVTSHTAVEQPKQEKVSFILRVKFEKTVKYAVDKRYPKYVKKLADFMKEHPETSIEIIGHTDNTAKEGYSVLLSQKRADSVRKYLIDDFGIDASRIHAIGYDAARPIADNSTEEGRQKNNRIEVVIEGLASVPVSSIKETSPAPAQAEPVKEVAAVKVQPPPPKTVAETAGSKQEKVSIILRVQFEKAGKYFINKKSDKYVKKLADFMKAHPETTIEIIGHTDNTGKEGRSILSSQKYADSVRKYLMDEFGIDASRINAVGYGSAKPVADNKTKAGRQRNNRIEVVIEGIQAN